MTAQTARACLIVVASVALQWPWVSFADTYAEIDSDPYIEATKALASFEDLIRRYESNESSRVESWKDLRSDDEEWEEWEWLHTSFAKRMSEAEARFEEAGALEEVFALVRNPSQVTIDGEHTKALQELGGSAFKLGNRVRVVSSYLINIGWGYQHCGIIETEDGFLKTQSIDQDALRYMIANELLDLDGISDPERFLASGPRNITLSFQPADSTAVNHSHSHSHHSHKNADHESGDFGPIIGNDHDRKGPSQFWIWIALALAVLVLFLIRQKVA